MLPLENQNNELKNLLSFSYREWELAADEQKWEKALVILDDALAQLDSFEDAAGRQNARMIVLGLKGSSYESLGELEIAVRFYVKSLRIDPEDQSSWSGLARILKKLGKPDLSARCYDRVTNERYKFFDVLFSD